MTSVLLVCSRTNKTPWHEKWTWEKKLGYFTVTGHKCVTKLWQTTDNTAHNFCKRRVIIAARGLSSDWVKQGGTEGKKGGRKEGSGKGEREDMTGLESSADTPLDGKGGFYFPHKEIISPSNCLLSAESRPNHLQLLQLWFVMNTLELFLAVFHQIFALLHLQFCKMSTHLHPQIFQILNLRSKFGSNLSQTLRHQAVPPERKFVTTVFQKAAKSVWGFFEGLRTLTPRLSLMLRYYASVSTQGTGLKKWAGIQGRGQFLQATGSNYAKAVMPYDEEESRARGWHLCCRWGYCYCCSQILLSPVRIWWMSHLAIGQACTTLSLQQKMHPPEASSVRNVSKAALNSSTFTDKIISFEVKTIWKHLELHLLLCAHR